jgi:hypothetical protein
LRRGSAGIRERINLDEPDMCCKIGHGDVTFLRRPPGRRCRVWMVTGGRRSPDLDKGKVPRRGSSKRLRDGLGQTQRLAKKLSDAGAQTWGTSPCNLKPRDRGAIDTDRGRDGGLVKVLPFACGA